MSPAQVGAAWALGSTETPLELEPGQHFYSIKPPYNALLYIEEVSVRFVINEVNVELGILFPRVTLLSYPSLWVRCDGGICFYPAPGKPYRVFHSI